MKETWESAKKEETIPARLLNDEDFVALMQAEFAAQTPIMDDIAKQKVWKKIESSLRGRQWRVWVPILGVAATLALVVLPLTTLLTESPDDRIKGDSTLVSTPNLQIFDLDSQGMLHSVSDQQVVGRTLVFKVLSRGDSEVALLLSRNEAKPSVRFKGRLKHLGQYNLLENGNNAYGYMPDPEDRLLRFCVVTMATAEQLVVRLPKVVAEWSNLPEESCVLLEITDVERN